MHTFAPIKRYAAVPEVSSLTASDPLLVGAKLQPFKPCPLPSIALRLCRPLIVQVYSPVLLPHVISTEDLSECTERQRKPQRGGVVGLARALSARLASVMAAAG